MCLLAGLASVSDVDPLGGLLPSFGLRPGESSVTCGDSPESPLTPFELTGLLLLDPLDLLGRVGLAVRTVSFRTI